MEKLWDNLFERKTMTDYPTVWCREFHTLFMHIFIAVPTERHVSWTSFFTDFAEPFLFFILFIVCLLGYSLCDRALEENTCYTSFFLKTLQFITARLSFIILFHPVILILVTWFLRWLNKTKTKTKLHGLSPLANYTDRATAACRRSDCQLVRIKGATWSAWRIPTAVFSVF
jgi:hypothetical protein